MTAAGPEFDRRHVVGDIEVTGAREGDASLVTVRIPGHAVLYLPPALAREFGRRLIDVADVLAPEPRFEFACVNPTHDHSRDPAPDPTIEGRQQRISCWRSRA